MYFENAGTVNTKETVALSLKAAIDNNIKHIVVASSSGDTAKLLANSKGINIICVTHVHGFKEPGKSELLNEAREELISLGIKILTTTHALSGAERSLSNKFGGIYPVELIANTLKLFGQGTKVGVEIAVMALDSGLVPYGEPIIAIGGSSGGNVIKLRIHKLEN